MFLTIVVLLILIGVVYAYIKWGESAETKMVSVIDEAAEAQEIIFQNKGQYTDRTYADLYSVSPRLKKLLEKHTNIELKIEELSDNNKTVILQVTWTDHNTQGEHIYSRYFATLANGKETDRHWGHEPALIGCRLWPS